MIININEIANGTYDHISEKEISKPSTYQERVFADRLVMAALFVVAIALAILVS